MQSRQYRAGDALDDYCPRERRVTEHAVVALVEGTVERTRCVACDVEHEYRHGRAPVVRRTKAPATAALYAQVLEGLEVPAGRVPAPPSRPAPAMTQEAPDAGPPPQAVVPPASVPTVAPPHSSSAAPAAIPPDPAPGTQAADPASQSPSTPQVEPPAPDAGADDRPFRRTLLRAQLPRHEGQVATTRVIPEFTMHQPPPPRGSRHRRFGGRPGPGFEGPMRSSRDFSHSQGRGPVAPPPQGAASSGEGGHPGGGHGRRRRRRRKKSPAQG